MNNGSQPANPFETVISIRNGTDEIIKHLGFTKREAIAMAAMQGMIANGSHRGEIHVAEDSVIFADALLKALEQPQQ